MARQSRLVVPDVVHHVVARGVNGASLFRHGFDKKRYIERAAIIAVKEKVLVHDYCLMNNHVHFLLTPTTPQGLARFFSRLHTQWAMYFNRVNKRTGHLFQCRFFSSPLSECHFFTALRYVEGNPVRAGLVKEPEDWPWSSAGHHLRVSPSSPITITSVKTRSTVDPIEWRAFLQGPPNDADDQLRRASKSSKPCGPPPFVEQLEKRFGRTLSPRRSALQVGTSWA